MVGKGTVLILIALILLAGLAVYQQSVIINSNQKIEALKDQVSDLMAELTKVNVTANYYKALTTTLQEQIQRLIEKVDELNYTSTYYKMQSEFLMAEVKNLGSQLSTFQARTSQLQEEIRRLTEERDALMQQVQELEAELNDLRQSYRELESWANAFETQMQEVLYYRTFRIYDYKADRTWYLYYRIPAEDYLNYRLDTDLHQPMTLENRLTPEILAKAAGAYDDLTIQEMAYDLRDIAGEDDELLVNLAIQVVHQLYYNVTLYAKYPLETLVESSGDCDNLATLLASILKASGFEVIILIGDVGTTGHAMLGVALDTHPTDLFEYGRDKYWYYEYDNLTYYMVEATWHSISEPGYIDPATSYALNHIGSMCGDNPWGDRFEIRDVVEVP
jgi:TolA-binding protein